MHDVLYDVEGSATEMNTRYCKGCDTVKPWSEFTIRRDTGKPCTLCKSCRSAKNNAEHVPNVPEQVPEHDGEIIELLREILSRLDMLEQRLDALPLTGTRPAADVNINIRTPAPEDDPRYQNVAAKLLGMNFEQAFNDVDKKRGH